MKALHGSGRYNLVPVSHRRQELAFYHTLLQVEAQQLNLFTRPGWLVWDFCEDKLREQGLLARLRLPHSVFQFATNLSGD